MRVRSHWKNINISILLFSAKGSSWQGHCSYYSRSLSGSLEDKNQKRVITGGFSSWVQSGGSSLLRAASATSATVGSSAPKASPDAGVTHALSSEDEFSDLDMRDLDEVDFQQLESQGLGRLQLLVRMMDRRPVKTRLSNSLIPI